MSSKVVVFTVVPDDRATITCRGLISEHFSTAILNARPADDLATALGDLKETQKLLDTSLKTLEALRPACIDTGMTWEEKARAQGALSVLSCRRAELQRFLHR